MRRSILLSLAYVVVAVVWQALLWGAMPNVGMGGLAVMGLVWPLLGLSVLCLWLLLRTATNGRTAIFVSALLLMLAASVALHPQDSQLGFAQKLGAVCLYFQAA